MLHAGASCLIGKDASTQELIIAIRAAAAGQVMLAPTVARRLVTWFRAQPRPPGVETYPEVKLTSTALLPSPEHRGVADT